MGPYQCSATGTTTQAVNMHLPILRSALYLLSLGHPPSTSRYRPLFSLLPAQTTFDLCSNANGHGAPDSLSSGFVIQCHSSKSVFSTEFQFFDVVHMQKRERESRALARANRLRHASSRQLSRLLTIQGRTKGPSHILGLPRKKGMVTRKKGETWIDRVTKMIEQQQHKK